MAGPMPFHMGGTGPGGDTGGVGDGQDEAAMLVAALNSNASAQSVVSSTGGLSFEAGRSRRGHGRKHEDLQQKYGASENLASQEITTLMMRNVPRNYTEEALISEIESYVSRDQYNFLYLPWDSRRSSNCGYAFINCLDPQIASDFRAKINGRKWRLVASQKDIKCVPAHVQGLALNLAHYMGSSVVEEGYQHSPMIIHKGQRIDFQLALDMFCPPELIEKHRQDAKDSDAMRLALMSSTSSDYVPSCETSFSGFGEGSFQGFCTKVPSASLFEAVPMQEFVAEFPFLDSRLEPCAENDKFQNHYHNDNKRHGINSGGGNLAGNSNSNHGTNLHSTNSNMSSGNHGSSNGRNNQNNSSNPGGSNANDGNASSGGYPNNNNSNNSIKALGSPKFVHVTSKFFDAPDSIVQRSTPGGLDLDFPSSCRSSGPSGSGPSGPLQQQQQQQQQAYDESHHHHSWPSAKPPPTQAAPAPRAPPSPQQLQCQQLSQLAFQQQLHQMFQQSQQSQASQKGQQPRSPQPQPSPSQQHRNATQAGSGAPGNMQLPGLLSRSQNVPQQPQQQPHRSSQKLAPPASATVKEERSSLQKREIPPPPPPSLLLQQHGPRSSEGSGAGEKAPAAAASNASSGGNGGFGISVNPMARELIQTKAYGQAWAKLNKQLEELSKGGLPLQQRSSPGSQ